MVAPQMSDPGLTIPSDDGSMGGMDGMDEKGGMRMP
jgi:hypothetical protein